MSSSLKEVVDVCANYRLGSEPLHKLLISLPESSVERVIGFVRDPLIPILHETASSIFHTDGDRREIRFVSALKTFEARSQALAQLCAQWRDDGLFSDTIGPRKWRNELYPVYYDPFRRKGVGREVAFALERSCCGLFGLVTYGVHMTMWLEGSKKMIVAKRATTKQTWAGYLDNAVAGGIPHGMNETDSMIKECMEEASLPEDFVRKHLKPVGVISYFHQAPTGWLQPEAEYAYDLIVPAKEEELAPQPKPLDGEVESFDALSVDEVVTLARQQRFKPNCALIIIDFLIRHGHVSPESEPDYLDIVTKMHDRMGFD